ncbi:MAG: hypothetical protein KAJ22_02625 [Candidatus Izimaplasma sp.]|nr:hypothetical protein [Candidatus Izimaplasma bacterium]
MNDDLKQEDTEEENLTIEKEELKSLLKAIEELEKMKTEKKEKPRNLISIEFGSVFHHNMYINFAFNFVLNLTLIYLVIELFQFAEYTDIIYVVILAFVYTLFESIYQRYVLFNHFSFVIKSLGFIFYIGYVAIFYILDVYLFGDAFSFGDETLLIAFVAIFTLVRYIIGTMLIRYFRKRNLR